MDDSQLKTEIDAIMQRVERIMETVDNIDAPPEESASPAEE